MPARLRRPMVVFALACICGFVGASLGYRHLQRRLWPEPKGVTIGLIDDEMARLSFVTRQECEGEAERVWVVVEGAGSCIAYVVSPGAVRGPTAVLYFHGDILGKFQTPAMSALRVKAHRQHTAMLQARFGGMPVMAIERPGMGVSSGTPWQRRTRSEGRIMNATVDALKKRYGLLRFALAGQSGGAVVVAQLLVLGRRDIVCAVMASGSYGIPKTWRIYPAHARDFERTKMVPLLDAAGIPLQPARRAFIIGDPEDKWADFEDQREWADKLRALGHRAELIETRAQDPDHHDLVDVALHAAGMCATGASDQSIRDKAVPSDSTVR